MSSKNKPTSIKFTKIHYGKWVALSKGKNEVVSYSSNLATLQRKVGKKDVVYTKAVDPNKVYAF